jgi:diguanylate cyclase (GGDEF)-like protein/PAS domain S-box-containing protein
VKLTSPELALQVLKAAGIGVAVVDSARARLPLTAANEAFTRTAGPVEGRALLDVLAAAPAVDELAAALADGHGWKGVVRLAGDEARHVELHADPLPGSAGAAVILRDVQHDVEIAERLALVEGRYSRVIDDLTAAERRYRELVERIPAVVYIAEHREGWPLRYVSPQIEALSGHPPSAFLADQELWYRLIHDDDRARVVAAETRALGEAGAVEIEYRLRRADGAVRWVSERDELVSDGDGRPLFTQGILIDVTAQREAEQRVREERDRAERYLDMTKMLVLVLDPRGRIEMLNRAGHELLGREHGALIGRDWFDACVAPEDRAVLRERFAEIAGGHVAPRREGYEAQVVTADGDVRVVSWTTTVLRDGEGRITSTLSSGVDVTERRRAERQIAHLAYHDPLTGLPNRALLGEHLDLALARARRNKAAVALLYLDLDDFKVDNDSLGHEAGDDILRRVAIRLRRRLRASDLLVRHGGDEFLLLLPDLPRDGAGAAARTAAEAIRAALAEPFEISGAEFHVGASVGISLNPDDAEDAETLLRHADAAMYQAKAGGPGELVVYGRDSRRPLERMSLSSRLRRAIAGDELVLYWQPVVALPMNMVTGVEALVRWQHPERGLLTPAQFVPFAEETGLIDRLGIWVADAVGAQRAAWRAEGLEPEVCVNVSSRELARGRFAADFVGRVGAGGVTVEVAAAAVSEDEAGVRAARELADLGARVAIADFGAGWAPPVVLRRLPVHAVKIDRSLLQGVPGDREAEALMIAVRGLADALGLEAGADGVETEAQHAFLAQHGWTAAQGHLFGVPVPEHELRDMLRGA